MESWIWIVLIVVAFVAFTMLKGYRSPAVLERTAQAIAAGAPVIDVRTPGEFDGDHHSGAINIPLAELRSSLPQLGPKGHPLVLYCRSGARSGQARRVLQAAGFSQLLDMGPRRNMTRLPPAAGIGQRAKAQPEPRREPVPKSRKQRRRRGRSARV